MWGQRWVRRGGGAVIRCCGPGKWGCLMGDQELFGVVRGERMVESDFPILGDFFPSFFSFLIFFFFSI